MEFGLFNLAPRRDPALAVPDLIRGVVDQARLAEEVGFDVAWFAEHHFSNLSISPSPLLTAAHCAAATRRIGLGTGVVVLPLYQPMRLAEEIAYVDILSEGRLRVGIGAGSQNHESVGFATDIRLARERFVEALDILEAAFDHGRVAYTGEHFRVSGATLSLTPVQRPYPPIYLAGLAEDEAIARRAARRGYVPFASAQWMPAPAVLKKRAGYESAWRAEGLDAAAMPFAVQRVVYVAESPADALDAAEQAQYTHRIVMAAKSGRATFEREFIQAGPVDGEQTPEQILGAAIIGDAERVAEMILEDAKALRPTHYSCFMHMGGMAPRRVLGAIERFGRDVLPVVRRALAERRADAAD